jgi:hypothetical protein
MHNKALGDDLRHNFLRLRPGVTAIGGECKGKASDKVASLAAVRVVRPFSTYVLSWHPIVSVFTLEKSRSEPIGIDFKALEGSSNGGTQWRKTHTRTIAQ